MTNGKTELGLGDFITVVPTKISPKTNRWFRIIEAVAKLSEGESLRLDCEGLKIKPRSVSQSLRYARRPDEYRDIKFSVHVDGAVVFITKRPEPRKQVVEFKERS